jgi:L-ascorbate metabolism protein UlaG (beta-lactamase superfamily)
MIIFIAIIVFITVFIFAFMQHPMFGKKSAGERLERIKRSPNYKKDAFENKSFTPMLTGDASYYKMMKQFFFEKRERVAPAGIIPSVKTDLLNLDVSKDVLVWFGHSSYFMQVDGKRILVDPVLSGHASPFSFMTKAFAGSDIYTTEDIPTIDYLFITHDHWDHLDYKALKKLKPKIKQVICSLGTGAHLEYWGYDKNIITEMDWDETISPADDFIVHSITARHFSGRTFTRNKAIWTAFVLQLPTLRILIGGDGGYDTHFVETGNKYGPFDLAILENGQYDSKWRYIHFMPGENLQAAKELGAKRVFPVHNSKFALGNHHWDEPLIKITEINKDFNIPLVTPMIGEEVNLRDETQVFSNWWVGMD